VHGRGGRRRVRIAAAASSYAHCRAQLCRCAVAPLRLVPRAQPRAARTLAEYRPAGLHSRRRLPRNRWIETSRTHVGGRAARSPGRGGAPMRLALPAPWAGRHRRAPATAGRRPPGRPPACRLRRSHRAPSPRRPGPRCSAQHREAPRRGFAAPCSRVDGRTRTGAHRGRG
jgi:hypothetical protein